MMGWRGRIGFLVPPGNPTLEPEMAQLVPKGVSLHFTRMVAHGLAGAHEGQEDRNRTQIAHVPENTALLAMVKPGVIVLAHTATSYTLGKQGEAELVARMEQEHGIPFITAFGSVLAAFSFLGIQRVAYATPYNEATTLQGRAHLEAHGLDVVAHGMLPNVVNIYDETPERAYALGRQVDHPDAQALFLSGVGMPTVDTINMLERDLGKPVISSATAMMWNALRIIGVRDGAADGGRLLSGGLAGVPPGRAGTP
jgi:maleate isomerase